MPYIDVILKEYRPNFFLAQAYCSAFYLKVLKQLSNISLNHTIKPDFSWF